LDTYDFIVVGAGLFGSIFAQQAREAGRSVLVLERRGHIGGNCHSHEFEDTGITVHSYGTHIFHTSDERVWRYMQRFSDFNQHRHRVLTTWHGKVYSLPINLGTINSFFGVNLRPDQAEAFLASKREPIASPGNLEEKAMSLVGRELYEAFVKGYTTKQWGCDPRTLPASIITRLPVRTSYHDGYFNDRYQGVPLDGYTKLFERLLQGVPVQLGVDFLADRSYWRQRAHRVVYTGPLDRYFDYVCGRLTWRSVRFELERLPSSDYQGVSVMNYADPDVPYTRIHEPKHLHLERPWNERATVIVREYSQVDPDEPYYPVNLEGDRETFARYHALAAEDPGVVFGGRLASYRYYDMHQVVGQALAKARELLSS